MTYFPAKSRSQNTDSRAPPSPIFLKISPRSRPDYTIIEVRIPPFLKPHPPTYSEALPTPPHHNSSTHTPHGASTRYGCREPCPLLSVLRHRTPSSPICLSEEIHKPFDLSHVFRLSSGGKSVLLVKKKALSRSGFLLSTHVVLKTRHVNPKIHVRRY